MCFEEQELVIMRQSLQKHILVYKKNATNIFFNNFFLAEMDGQTSTSYFIHSFSCKLIFTCMRKTPSQCLLSNNKHHAKGELS